MVSLTTLVNFSIDLDFLLRSINEASRDRCGIHIITSGESVKQQLSVHSHAYNVQLHRVHMDDQVSLYHSAFNAVLTIPSVGHTPVRDSNIGTLCPIC